MAPTLSVELTGDEVKLFKSMQRIIGQQKKMEDGFGKVKKESEKAGKTSEKGFGSQATGMLKSYVTSVSTVAVAWQHAQAAMQHYQQEVKSAMDETRGLTDARRRLAQVGGGDATKVADLNRRADAAAVASGVDRATARQILFSGTSEGFEGDFERILSFQSLINPNAAAMVAGRGPGLFKGQITPLQAINATFAAAEKSNLGFEEIARALPRAAEGAAQNDANPVETIAALSVLAGRYNSADSAATDVAGFMKDAALDERTSGQGLIDAVRTVQNMSDEDRRDFLGESKELNTAFGFLSRDLPAIEGRMKEIANAINTAGTDDSIVMKGVRSQLEGSPEFAALINANKSRIQKEIAQEQVLARTGFEIESRRDEIRARQFSNGVNAYDRYLNDKAGDFTEFAGGDDSAVEAAQRFGALFGGFGGVGPQVSRLVGLVEADAEKQERAVRALENLQRPPSQSRPDADR